MYYCKNCGKILKDKVEKCPNPDCNSLSIIEI